MLKGTEEKTVKIEEMMDNTDEKQEISTEIQGKKEKSNRYLPQKKIWNEGHLDRLITRLDKTENEI